MNHVERADIFMKTLPTGEVYRVGGSVRDELLGLEPKDADYLVRGVPLDLLGAHLRDLRGDWPKFSVTPLVMRDGRQQGWRVSARGLRSIEIMLPRTEVPRALTPEEKLQGGGVRRAFDIMVDPDVTLEQDAVRRDFTFNALYKIVQHPDGLSNSAVFPNGSLVHDILDPTGCGLYDLQHKLIRTTHVDSFRDDPLRTLRALRFVSTLGYDLSRDTMEQMAARSAYVDGLTANGYASGTVLNEMSKLLMGDNPARALRAARNTWVLGRLFPELAPMLGFDQGSRYHDMTTDEHTFKALETAVHVGAPLRVRWALLFHDAGKPESAWIGTDGRKHYYGTTIEGLGEEFDRVTEDHEVVSERLWREAAKRLSAPVELREDVARLVRHHMVNLEGKFRPSRVRRMRVTWDDAFLRDLLLHRACDVSGKGRGNPQHLERIRMMEEARAQAEHDGVPRRRKDLAITGHDLMQMGLEGTAIGRVQDAILDEVVIDPSPQKRTREWQLMRAEALRG